MWGGRGSRPLPFLGPRQAGVGGEPSTGQRSFKPPFSGLLAWFAARVWAAGEWRDYAIDFPEGIRRVFCFFPCFTAGAEGGTVPVLTAIEEEGGPEKAFSAGRPGADY